MFRCIKCDKRRKFSNRCGLPRAATLLIGTFSAPKTTTPKKDFNCLPKELASSSCEVSMKNHDQVLHVWGDFACFTRPEMKVERFSYPVITPSAARGIYDAIYCKPVEFRWQVTEIEILSPVNWIALQRNEVKSVVQGPTVSKWMSGKSLPEPLFADDTDERTQRQTIALRNVNYRLHARIVPC